MTDLYDDTAHATIRRLLAERPGAAAYLKTAEFEDTRDEIPQGAFAWSERRRLPVHTREHAVASFLYAEDAEVPAHVRAKVAEALVAYGVSPAELAPETEKAAAEDECLFPDGSYPVRNADEVRYAEARLLPQAGRLPLEDRVVTFHKLACAADRHGVDLHPMSQAWGMSAFANVEKVQDALTGRYYLAKTAEHRRAYADIGESLREEPHMLRGYQARVKLASTLLKLDAAAGITGSYNRQIPDPLCSVFNTTVKVGAQLVGLGNDAYELSTLAGLPPSFYADTLGPEVLSEIAPGGRLDPEQLAAVLPTLPADMLRQFQQGLASAGVKPTGI